MKSIIIGKSVTSIGYQAFYECSSLTSVTIPSSVTEIGSTPFSYCNGLKSIIVESENPNFASKDGVLYTKNFETLICGPAGFTGHLEIPASVTSIESYAFNYCRGLTGSLVIPDSVYYIGYMAFACCNGLTNVTIPKSATRIDDCAFQSCSSLTAIKVDGRNPLFASKAGVLYTKNFEKLVCCPGGLKGKFEIPSSVTTIGNNAFAGCSDLTSIEIPNSVTSIELRAFEYCSGLKSITLPNSVTSTGELTFYDCSGLRSVIIPNSVKEIGMGAFYDCFNLESIEIPSSVNSIGSSAFYNCSGLKSVTIPNSVKEIGNGAFCYCFNLESIEIPSSVQKIGNSAFYYCDALTQLTLADGLENLWIESNPFEVANLYLGRNISGNYSFPKIESLTVGGFVTNIPGNTYNLTSLTSVTINQGAQVVIEDDAFSGCENLSELILPADIAEIGDNAFKGTALTDVTVPGGRIGENAFADCNLANIILGADVEDVGEKAFDGSDEIQNVYSTRTTPPAAQNNTFSNYDAQLWVPEEAMETYCNFNPCWDGFTGKPLVCPENIMVTGPASISGSPGTTLRLSATITPANVTLDRVLWSSTNPSVATVDNNGIVTIHNFQPSEETLNRATEEEPIGYCQIIASTLYEESPVAIVNIEVSESDDTYIDYINSEDRNTGSSDNFNQNAIYTLDGVCLTRNGSQTEVNALGPGIYVFRGKKIIVK